jgi:protein MpaA
MPLDSKDSNEAKDAKNSVANSGELANETTTPTKSENLGQETKPNKTSGKNENFQFQSSIDYRPAKNKNHLPLPMLEKFCQELDQKFISLGWKNPRCLNYSWNHVRNSVENRPLVWFVHGDEGIKNDPAPNTTLVFCGVHGDEITPMRFCFDIINHILVNQSHYQDSLIVVAPLANPDSFFKAKPTRTNANGVDINRNFPTDDWNKQARKLWIEKFRKDPRRNPGDSPISEPEVVFQVNLIKRYMPDKIISVHAPLTMLDYDGPELSESADAANELLIQMSKKAAGYKVMDYPYFPGSLGKYAGKEKNIPTYTLELPTSDPRYSDHYWNLFRNSIHHAFVHDLRSSSKEVVSNEE